MEEKKPCILIEIEKEKTFFLKIKAKILSFILKPFIQFGVIKKSE